MDDPNRSEPPSASIPPDADGSTPAMTPEGAMERAEGLVPESDQQTVISRQPPRSDWPMTPATVRDLGKLLIGQQLGHFRLEEFVGGGGMGAVFRATDSELGRTVAVKVVSGASNDEDTLRRFKNEAQSAARLDHQNIARVYYVGVDKGWHYIVFEFIQGVNIRDLVQHKGPLPVEEAIYYTLQVAEALDHAAKRNVVHRDIKPSNVLVMPDGMVKLVDMGLARLHQVDATNDLTASGVTLGTFDYISPEQAREPRNADVRSDLYSLGCTLYFMLTGQPPFPQGTVLQKLLSHSSEMPPDPRDVRPELSDECAAVVHRLLAKNPADRFQTPADLIAQLLVAADAMGLSLGGRRPTFVVSREPMPQFSRHWPWIVPTAALLVLVVVLDLASAPRILTVHRPVLPPAPARLTTPDSSEPTGRSESTEIVPAAGGSSAAAPGTDSPGGDNTPQGTGTSPTPTGVAPPTEDADRGSAASDAGTTDPVAGESSGPSVTPGLRAGTEGSEGSTPRSDSASGSTGSSAAAADSRPSETSSGGNIAVRQPSGDTTEGPAIPSASGAPASTSATGEASAPASSNTPTGTDLTAGNVRPPLRDGTVDEMPTEPDAAKTGSAKPAGDGVSSAPSSPDAITRVIVSPRSDNLPVDAIHAPTFSSALARVESLPSVEVIELAFDGEYEESPLVLNAKRRLEIRAAPGFQPVLAFRPQSSPLAGQRRMIDMGGGNFDWSGIHFSMTLPSAPSQGWALFGLHDLQSVEFRDCTLTVQNMDANGVEWQDDVAFFEYLPPRMPRRMEMEMDMAVAGSPMANNPMSRVPPVINLTRCSARGQATFLRLTTAHPIHLIWNEGLLVTNHRLLQTRGTTDVFNWDAEMQVQLQHVTAVVDDGLVLAEMDPSAPLMVDLDVEMLDCVLLSSSDAPLLEYRGVADPAKAERSLKFRGDRNFYPTWRAATPSSPRPARRVRWRLTTTTGEVREFGFDQKDAEWYEEKTAKESVLWHDFPMEPPADRPYHLHVRADYRLDSGVRNPARAAGATLNELPAFPAHQPAFSSPGLPALPSTSVPGNSDGLPPP